MGIHHHPTHILNYFVLEVTHTFSYSIGQNRSYDPHLFLRTLGNVVWLCVKGEGTACFLNFCDRVSSENILVKTKIILFITFYKMN